MTQMIEGDIKLLKSVYFQIIGFLRRKNVDIPNHSFIEEIESEIKYY